MKVIAVCNNKGGVGKTTTTLAMLDYFRDIGDLFHEHPNRRALAIDLDPSTTALTDRTKAMTGAPYTVYNVLTDDRLSLLDAVAHTSVGDVVPCSEELEILAPQMDIQHVGSREEYRLHLENLMLLRDRIRQLDGTYDVVLIDCPAQIKYITLSALVASDSTVIPIEGSQMALQTLGKLSSIITLAKQYNPSLTVEGMLFTRYGGVSKRDQIAFGGASAIAESLYGCKVFDSHIRTSVGTFGEGGDYRLPRAVKEDYRKFMVELLEEGENGNGDEPGQEL